MKLTSKLLATIKAAIEENEIDMDYGYVGVRIQRRPFELGSIDHVSHVWVDGDDTGEELDGICAINIKSLDMVARAMRNGEYPGDHVAIIAGDDATYGEDLGEIIINDPTVAAIIC